MARPKLFLPADLGGEPDEIAKLVGRTLFKPVVIEWTRPRRWHRDEVAPTDKAEEAPGHLYALIRDHHLSKQKETIVYIGLTNDLQHRFANHPKANELSSMRGDTTLSIANINFGSYRTAISHNKAALEELEHILIWTLNPKLNEKKTHSLPGLSRKSRAWHIFNTGHRFSGRMPREIIYPWILTKPGRDRSFKT